MLFEKGRIKSISFFLKVFRLAEFLMFNSNLLYCDITDGENKFLK